MAKTLEQIMEEQMQAFIKMKLSQQTTAEQPAPADSSEEYSDSYDEDYDSYEDDGFGAEEEIPIDTFDRDLDDEADDIFTSQSTSTSQDYSPYRTQPSDSDNDGSPNRVRPEDWINTEQQQSPVKEQNQGGSPESLQSQIIIEMSKQIETLKAQIEAMSGGIKTEKQYYSSPDMQAQQKSSYKNVFGSQQPFERVVSDPCTASFCGNPFRYQRYEQETDFGESFKLGESFEDSAKNFRKISKNIVRDIEKMFGGLNRITDIAVVSDILIFNGVSYEPLLPDSYVSNLPLDVQNAVRDGQFAWLFDFEELKSMPNLTNLMFDNTDFLFRKVRVDLTARRDFEPKHLFKYFGKLTNLQVGEYVFNRNNLDEYDDIFHQVRRSTEIADAIDSWGMEHTKMSWNCVKDIYRNSNKRGVWKALSVVGMTGLTVAAGGGTLAFKMGRLGTKVTKGVVNGVRSLIEATKENL